MHLLPRYLRIAMVIIAITFSFIYGLQETDFYVFLHAGKRLARHADIYAVPHYRGLQYYYSPFFALVLLPFSAMPFFIPATAWILFSLYLIGRIWSIACGYLDSTLLERFEEMRWVAISAVFIFTTLEYNIGQGQMTIFLVWATLQAIWLFGQRRDVAGSLLLALAINIKIMPLVFIPYLLYRGYYRALTLTVMFLLLFLFLPAIFIGGSYNNSLLLSWGDVINPCNHAHLIESEKALHSLVSTIPVYLTHTTNELGLNVNIIDIGVRNAERACTAVRVLLIFLTLFFLKVKPMPVTKAGLHHYWEICYLLLITPLIFPHQNKYSYFYLFPAVIYMVYFMVVAARAMATVRYRVLLVCLVTLSIVYSPLNGRDIIGDYCFDLLQVCRVQVICTIFFIPALLFCSPHKLSRLLLVRYEANRPRQQ